MAYQIDHRSGFVYHWISSVVLLIHHFVWPVHCETSTKLNCSLMQVNLHLVSSYDVQHAQCQSLCSCRNSPFIKRSLLISQGVRAWMINSTRSRGRDLLSTVTVFTVLFGNVGIVSVGFVGGFTTVFSLGTSTSVGHWTSRASTSCIGVRLLSTMTCTACPVRCSTRCIACQWIQFSLKHNCSLHLLENRVSTHGFVCTGCCQREGVDDIRPKDILHLFQILHYFVSYIFR